MEENPAKIDPQNKFLVSSFGRGILIGRHIKASMTPTDALLLAAWLVTLAENRSCIRFDDILKAVKEKAGLSNNDKSR